MPGTQVAPSTRGELALLRVQTPRASLLGALQGAHVVEWSPPDLEHPVLWLSPRSGYTRGRAVRGGVPLCFPWFGPHPADSRAPQHGFARTREWDVDVAAGTTTGEARLAFSFNADETTRAAWPHDFGARLVATAGEALDLALEVRNTGHAPFTFTAALHTYLAVSDVRTIAIHGLEHTDYLDKTAGGARHREGTEPLTLSGETDRVYLDTTAPCVVHDPGWRRRIHVSKTGSRSTVVWNPWQDKAAALADLGPEAWTGFVCVETCNAADDTVTLAPGATHTLGTRIHIERT